MTRAHSKSEYKRRVAMGDTTVEPPAEKRVSPPLEMWTVYERPADYPDQFVARRWLIDGSPEPVPTHVVLLGRTIADVLSLLPPGLTMLPRDESDPTSVVGTWL